MNADMQAQLKQAMELRRKDIERFLNELHAEGFTKVKYYCPYVRWEDMGRFEVDGKMSAWGPEIADMSGYYYTDGTFRLLSAASAPEVVTDAKLMQTLRAYQSASSQAAQVIALNLSRGGGGSHSIYIVKSSMPADKEHPIKVFDARGDGDVLTVKSLVQWFINGKPLPSEVAAKCDAAISSGDPQRFTHQGRDVYAIPSKSYSVSMLHYLKQDDKSDAKKVSVTAFYDQSGIMCNDVNAAITPKILNQAAGLPASALFHLTEDSTPCVVVGAGTSLSILNGGGKGKHLRFDYTPGFDTPLFTIRSPNLNEQLSNVSMERVKAVCGGKMRNLLDMAKEAGTAAVAKPFGMEDGVDLSAPTDKDVVNGIRFQATLVPGGKDAEVYEKAFSYQTRDDMSPTALYAHCTSFGTSFTTPGAGSIKLQPCTVNAETGDISAFNLSIKADNEKDVGDDATYTAAQNQKLLDDGRGMAVPLGPVGFEKVPNASMLVQWPVSAYGRPVQEAAPDLFEVEEEEEEPHYLSAGAQYRSLGVNSGGSSAAPVYRSLSTGSLKVATCGYGSYQGKARGIKNGKLQRRADVKPTITYNRFYSIEAPEGERAKETLPGLYTVTKEHVRKVVKMLDSCYEIAGKSHQLFDKEEGTAIKVTAAQFAADPISDYAMGQASAPAAYTVDAPKQAEVAADGPLPKKPRYDLHEVLVPKMVAVEM
jgi:hypothetical protein